MPTNKQEIIRHVNEIIAQIKNKTYKSPFKADFADVIIEGSGGGNRDRYTGERINPAVEINAVRPSDPVQDRLMRMRQIAREVYQNAMPIDRYRDRIFYKQAKFMADFEDDYQGSAQLQMYFPNYQMMSNDQLRTYFTWRSRVRGGNITKTDLSYVFLYVYEIINNIGVSDGDDGINKLISFWNAYRQYTKKADNYMAAWIRDYYVLNKCSYTFNELLLREPLLQKYYPMDSDRYSLDYYERISVYKIKDSIFYTPENEKMLTECFEHILERLNGLMGRFNRKFNDLIFDRSIENTWHPFSNAIFLMRQEHFPHTSKIIELNDEMIYRYKNGRWTYIKGGLYSAKGRQLVGYIFRRMEQLLRGAVKFKYKLSADDKLADKRLLDRLLPGTGSKGFLSEIDLAVKEYYVNSKKTIVRVDERNLEKIRENALITQEKLIVSESEGPDNDIGSADEPAVIPGPELYQAELFFSQMSVKPNLSGAEQREHTIPEPAAGSDIWTEFICSLDPIELEALRRMLGGTKAKDMLEYSRSKGCMTEVLLDSINQKALDITGDTILELTDEIVIFEDYIENLRKAVERE